MSFQANNAKRHLIRFGPDHPNECATCGVPVQSWDEHCKHVEKEHGGNWRFKCGKCDDHFEVSKVNENTDSWNVVFCFQDNDLLRTHMRESHVSDICQRKYKSNESTIVSRWFYANMI